MPPIHSVLQNGPKKGRFANNVIRRKGLRMIIPQRGPAAI